MDKYMSLTRTTLHEAMNDGVLPHAGIYIVAYMGRVLYVGKSEEGVGHRLTDHIYNCGTELLGGWMYKVRDDWHNVRLDVLEAPDGDDWQYWLQSAESALVRVFNPLFNIALMQ
jgi:hypothetical protein